MALRTQIMPPRRESRSIRCVAQPRGILRNHIEHRLDIRRRAGDDAENFTRRRLLLQRLMLLDSEQPDVLNRDNGLVGEGFEQLDLRGREGAHLDATCVQ